MQKKIRVAVDAMGGDYAPSEIIKGAVSAGALDPGIQIVLVGKEEVIKKELTQLNQEQVEIEIQNASEVVDMDDPASWSIKRKRDSSIAVAATLVKKKKADACVSAGNTGAVTSASLLLMGRLPGLSRPAIGINVPAATKSVFLLDVGATADCKPKNLLQFAKMAHIYLEKVIGVKNPSVGILSIGEEKGKGNELIREAYKLLEKSGLNFMGNIEGRDILEGRNDIVVCDGFTGNVALKLMEGVVHLIFGEIKKVTQNSFMGQLGGVLLKPKLKELKKQLDHEEYGGAPLLGVDGVCVICHGSSKAKAVKNAVGAAAKTVRENVTAAIAAEIGKEGKD